MKKIYFLLVLVLGFAVRLSAQTAIESITVLNWDGSELEGNMLFLGVGETKTLKLAVQPADADLSTISLGMELLDDDLENGGPMAFHGMNITAYKAGSRNLYVYSNRQLMASVLIEAWYEESGSLYPDSTVEGQVWFSINAKGKLQFWAEELGKEKPDSTGVTYDIPDYKDPYEAPWYNWMEFIKEVDLANLDNIGDNAFNNLINLRHVTFPYAIQSLGNYVFNGCYSLNTLEVERVSYTADPMITMTTGESLIIDDNDQKNPVRPELVIVNSWNEQALYMYSSENYEWSQCGKVILAGGSVPGETSVRYEVEPSEESEGIQLTLRHNGWSTDDAVLPDRTTETYPWDELGDQIQDLKISDRIKYIGADVFSTLTNLQTIQFNQKNAPIDSINLWAFNWEIQPWKFAFGDPQDGPICPPKIVGGPDEEEMQHHAREIWSHFMENTVLYVPDSTFEYQGEQVRAIDLYRADPIWGEVFNRITDRTVEIEGVDSQAVVLKWLPLENAEVYRLTIRQVNCSDCGEIVVEIPATGVQGLVDWDQMPNPIVRRAPREDEHGGMTLTITVQDGTGTAHNNDIEVSVTGMEEGKAYSYNRDVEKSTGVDVALSKEGAFDVKLSGIDNVYAQGTGEMKIYDLLGRTINCAVEDLPEGIYIFTDGVTRTKMYIRR